MKNVAIAIEGEIDLNDIDAEILDKGNCGNIVDPRPFVVIRCSVDQAAKLAENGTVFPAHLGHAGWNYTRRAIAATTLRSKA